MTGQSGPHPRNNQHRYRLYRSFWRARKELGLWRIPTYLSRKGQVIHEDNPKEIIPCSVVDVGNKTVSIYGRYQYYPYRRYKDSIPTPRICPRLTVAQHVEESICKSARIIILTYYFHDPYHHQNRVYPIIYLLPLITLVIITNRVRLSVVGVCRFLLFIILLAYIYYLPRKENVQLLHKEVGVGGGWLARCTSARSKSFPISSTGFKGGALSEANADFRDSIRPLNAAIVPVSKRQLQC